MRDARCPRASPPARCSRRVAASTSRPSRVKRMGSVMVRLQRRQARVDQVAVVRGERVDEVSRRRALRPSWPSSVSRRLHPMRSAVAQSMASQKARRCVIVAQIARSRSVGRRSGYWQRMRGGRRPWLVRFPAASLALADQSVEAFGRSFATSGCNRHVRHGRQCSERVRGARRLPVRHRPGCLLSSVTRIPASHADRPRGRRVPRASSRRRTPPCSAPLPQPLHRVRRCFRRRSASLVSDRTGTSFATGTPRRVIVTSSPATARSRTFENCWFASRADTVLICRSP